MARLMFAEVWNEEQAKAIKAQKSFLAGEEVILLIPKCSKEELEAAKALLNKPSSKSTVKSEASSINYDEFNVVALDFEGTIKGYRVEYRGTYYDLLPAQYNNCKLKGNVKVTKKRKLHRDSSDNLLKTKDELNGGKLF